MMQLAGMSPRSWKDDRLPDILWAVVIRSSLSQEESLVLFRKIAEIPKEHNGLFDITHSGIKNWTKEERKILFNKLSLHSDEVTNILRQLTFFKSLPNRDEWVEHFGEPEGREYRLEYIAKGISTCFNHQSQEATDCRWLKVLCLINSGKIKMPYEMYEKILGYPSIGNQREVRPLIRATEIGPFMENKKEWSEEFWKEAMGVTLCKPYEREPQRRDIIKINHDAIARARHLLILHSMSTDETSSVDPIHDTVFGYGMYSLRLLDEIVATNLSRGAIGRIVLRTLVENYITLGYLIEMNDIAVWKSFRDYGIGQMKQAFLKINDSSIQPPFFDTDYVKLLANEDRWVEFINIELGDWDKSDLRKRADKAGLKDIYDKYYDWTSGYSHGSWGAIRESCFGLCINPLHKFHSIPDRSVFPLPGILDDSVEIVNKILELIEKKYPDIHIRIEDISNIKKVPYWKQVWNRFRYRKEQKELDALMGL